MRLGYACVNYSLDCRCSGGFRLASYSEERLVETVQSNLDCLLSILEFNLNHKLMFFRISSDLIPFASHPVCTAPWQKIFEPQFTSIGEFIRSNGMRISMHPDQYTVINALKPQVVENAVGELMYHAELLDLLGLGADSKIQIHIGGVYDDRQASMERFCRTFEKLDAKITERLVIENDDRSYSLADCRWINSRVGIPVLFDNFHHELNNNGETVSEAMQLAAKTWQAADGVLMCDYSSQRACGKVGQHARSIDLEDFGEFIKESEPVDFDLILEIKDKERSALKALSLVESDQRFTSVRQDALAGNGRPEQS